VLRAAVSFGRRGCTRFAANQMKRKGQEGAPGESREDMRDRGTRGSPWATNFAGDARRLVEVR
jgi:hypothetical protein